jgi:hypothetical protein
MSKCFKLLCILLLSSLNAYIYIYIYIYISSLVSKIYTITYYKYTELIGINKLKQNASITDL